MSGSISAALAAAAATLASSLQSLAEAVRAAANDPADQIRVLAALATFSPTSTGIEPASAVQTAIAAACRRAALTSLARAAAAYQPSSYEDAINLATNLVNLFDAEMQTAADAFDTGSYEALRTLRAAVMQNLVTRAASLAHVITVSTPVPMPALALAYKLYRDATRADDLIARNDPIHPCFMPTTLEALSS